MATANPFRFSTKYQDDETGLLYYGYRYYDASTGRWLSRDPIEESGGVNLYGFVYEDANKNIDLLGFSIVNRPPDQASQGGGATYGPPGRLSPEQCAALLASIIAKSAKLTAEVAKYDPVADGKGGFPTGGGGVTKPGGHYIEIQQLKQGLENDIKYYLKECRACGPQGPAIPVEVYDGLKKPVQPPVLDPVVKAPYTAPGPVLPVPPWIPDLLVELAEWLAAAAAL
jgi:RHS repeat-associated protein